MHDLVDLRGELCVGLGEGGVRCFEVVKEIGGEAVVDLEGGDFVEEGGVFVGEGVVLAAEVVDDGGCIVVLGRDGRELGVEGVVRGGEGVNIGLEVYIVVGECVLSEFCFFDGECVSC